MDIIKANECLRHFYGPPRKGSYDNEEVGVPAATLKGSCKGSAGCFKGCGRRRDNEDNLQEKCAAIKVDSDKAGVDEVYLTD